MTGGGRYRQPFFPFSVNNSLSMKKMGKVNDCFVSFFSILQVSTICHFNWTNYKEKKASTVITINHDGTMSAEKTLS